MQQLITAINTGWAIDRKQCPPALIPFYNNRSELIEDNGLVFFGERLVVPSSLRKEMLQQIHKSHIGIEGCLRRAREVIYWPRMNAEVKDYVSKCSICQTHQPEQCREPLKSYDLPQRPWSVVGGDLFQLGHQQFLIIVDYWSGFFEVQELSKVTSKTVITASKVQFARHGIPDTLISDNGPQFASAEFAQFTNEWQIEHRTSSPHYPQSNGCAENAVNF
jgi:transposase InsO family protein